MAKYQLSKEEIKQLQRLIGAEEDGLWGPKSKAALNEYILSQYEPMTEPSTAEYNPLFNTGRLPVKVDKPEPVADYREDKEPINYMDALLALKNLESNKPMPRVPSSWVGWASYINSGDKGLLSEFAEADKAWNMKKLDEEEKARQLMANIKQKELDRKNAKEIAKQNKEDEFETKKDEYIRGRNKAASILNYAQQALAKDPNNIQLKKDVQLAKEDFDYYDRKLGGKGYDNIPVQTEQPSEGLTNNQVNDIVKAIVDKPSYTNDERNKLMVLKDYVTDPVLKEQIDTVLSKKGATKEDKDRAFKAAQDNFARTGNYDSNLYKLDYSVDKNGQQIVKLLRK